MIKKFLPLLIFCSVALAENVNVQGIDKVMVLAPEGHMITAGGVEAAIKNWPQYAAEIKSKVAAHLATVAPQIETASADIARAEAVGCVVDKTVKADADAAKAKKETLGSATKAKQKEDKLNIAVEKAVIDLGVKSLN